MSTPAPHAFADLLDRALIDPGTVHAAYRAFHGYSIGNQLLAAFQCAERGIPLGPLATFPQWKERGRYVRKGEKALTLCQPVTCKVRQDDTDPDAPAGTITRFIFRPRWFVLAQTDGDAYEQPAPEGWDKARALAALDITEEPFAHLDGNCQGYARQRTVAVSPVAAFPLKTLFHELAHVVIGHTAESEQTDDERTPRSLREIEAEGTAMIVCAALQLPGIEHSRGYMQHWAGDGNTIPERSAARIFSTASAILKAGRNQATTDDEEGGRE